MDVLILQLLPVGLDSAPFPFWKNIHPLVNYWCEKLLKIVCLLSECLGLLVLLSEAIPTSHFVQETFVQKSEFVVNIEKLIWQTQEVMAE